MTTTESTWRAARAASKAAKRKAKMFDTKDLWRVATLLDVEERKAFRAWKPEGIRTRRMRRAS